MIRELECQGCSVPVETGSLAMQVRVRTAQLAERNHSTEGRLTYVEDHVTKIRSKMKQIRVRTLDCSSMWA